VGLILISLTDADLTTLTRVVLIAKVARFICLYAPPQRSVPFLKMDGLSELMLLVASFGQLRWAAVALNLMLWLCG